MRNILSKSLLIPLVLLIVLPISTIHPVLAQMNEVKQLEIEENTSEPIDVYLSPGQGVTIDYRRTGQTIETVWLDNKRYVGISTDGSLLGLNEGASSVPGSALHLNLIENQANNSIERSDHSLLTVVTIDPKKQRRYFLYNVFPNYHLHQGESTKLIEYIMPIQTPNKFNTAKLIKNIDIMTRKGLITNLELIKRINKLIDLLNDGLDLSQAAREAKVSMKFINSVLAQD